jgi:hypothetical protein
MSVVAAMLFAASTALAGGLNLAWNNCASEGGVANRTSTCLANNGSNILTGSFVPDADITGVTGIECVLDFIAGDGTSAIPAWWEISGATSCRPTALSATGGVNPNNTICNDWGAAQQAGGVAAFNSSGSIPAANLAAHRRIVVAFAVPLAAAPDLTTANEYWAFNCAISNAKTVGTGSCAGCATPVCVVLNSINVVPGTAAGQFISAGTSAASNQATWQGLGPNCSLVPTKNATWGQVKALYH